MMVHPNHAIKEEQTILILKILDESQGDCVELKKKKKRREREGRKEEKKEEGSEGRRWSCPNGD